jgi:hypothetical protein
MAMMPGVAGVSGVRVSGGGYSDTDWRVAANHPSDSALYVWLPYPSSGSTAYGVAVELSGGQYRAFTVTASSNGSANVVAAVPSLNVTPPTFAAITQGDPPPAAKAMSIANVGGAPANVSGVTASSDSFSIAGPASFTVAPGTTDTSVSVAPAAGLGVGTHTATIAVTYDGSPSVASVTVSLVVNAAPPVVTRVLSMVVPSFAAVDEGYGQPVAKGIVLTNSGSGGLAVSSVVSSDPAKFEVVGSVVSIPAGGSDSASFVVRPTAGLGVGTHTATLTATYDGTSETTVSGVVTIQVNKRQTPPDQNQTTSPPDQNQTTAPPPGGGQATPPPGSGATNPPPSNNPTKLVPSLTVKLVKAAIAKGKTAQVKVTVKGKGIVKPTGKIKVTVKKGAKTVKTKTYWLAARAGGKTTVKLPALSAGKYTVTVTYQGSATVAAKTAKAAKKLTVR